MMVACGAAHYSNDREAWEELADCYLEVQFESCYSVL